MTREEFDALVNRIEQRYAGRPQSLKLKIAWLLTLGYGLFLCWLIPVSAVAMALLVGSVYVPTEFGVLLIIIGAILLTYGFVQAAPVLWTPFPEPKGHVLQRSRVPDFFARLDQLRRASHAPRSHKVIVTSEFGAAVQWIPRLGLLGWTKRYLILGLPLMESLDVEQFEAVLAHELAHQSAKHGRFTAWIYRVRSSWERVLDRVQQRNAANNHQTNWFVTKWMDWYWPRFNAYAFVLSRSNEYQADRAAAEWAGAETAASALWQVGCVGQRLDEKFWPAINQLATTEAEPPTDFIQRQMAFLTAPAEKADAERWMDDVSLRLTNNLNTHPSFADRLKAIGLSPELFRRQGFPQIPQTAASSLLDTELDTARTEVNSLWMADVADVWRSRHGRASARQRELHKIDATIPDADANPETLWAKARALWDLSGPESAEPVLRKLLTIHPSHSQANLTLGQHLLGLGNIEGQEFLLRILKQEEDALIPHACEALSNFYEATGRSDQVAHVHRRLSLYETAAEAARTERSQVLPGDIFIRHTLTSEELDALQQLLKEHPHLASAYLVQKELKHFVQQRLFVLCVHSARNWLGSSDADKDTQLAEILTTQVKLPGRMLVITPSGGFRTLAKKIIGLEGSRIV